MEMHLFEDSLSDGQRVVFGETAARAIYVTAGAVSVDERVYGLDEGFVADGPVTLTAGGGAGAGACRRRSLPYHPGNPPGSSEGRSRTALRSPAISCGWTACPSRRAAARCCIPIRGRASAACAKA